MKKIIIALFIAAISFNLFAEEATANSVLFKDSNGMVVDIKEQYSGSIIDTCTIVFLLNGNFVIVHRNKPASFFPQNRHSVRVIESFKTKH